MSLRTSMLRMLYATILMMAIQFRAVPSAHTTSEVGPSSIVPNVVRKAPTQKKQSEQRVGGSVVRGVGVQVTANGKPTVADEVVAHDNPNADDLASLSLSHRADFDGTLAEHPVWKFDRTLGAHAGFENDRITSWKGKSFASYLDQIVLDRDFVDYLAGTTEWGHVGSPSLSNFLETCQSEDPDAIKIRRWMGWLGNRLWQLHVAILIAQASGRRYVHLPEKAEDGSGSGQPASEVFDFPKKIEINTTFPHQCKLSLDTPTYDCAFTYFQRCESTVGQRLAVYKAYILPYIKADVWKACDREEKDTLTVHVRNGDEALHSSACHQQPPCEYFHTVISRGYTGRPFPRVRLVASDESPKNPCVHEIISKHAEINISYQPGMGIAHDYCLLIKARNLALTTSSFSTTAKMFGSELIRLFYYDGITDPSSTCTGSRKERHRSGYDLDDHEMCRAFPSTMRIASSNASSIMNCAQIRE